MSASQEIQDNVNTLERRVQTGTHDDGTVADEQQMSIWINDLVSKQAELKVALEEEENKRESLQAQEAEVQAITLPYDFDELFSEEGHPVTGANDMIIEVVKDTKRQANIEKNQALDEQKAMFDAKLSEVENDLQFKIDSMKKIIENGTSANAELTREIGDVRAYLQQVNLERDDAFNKRDAAFRQLQEAREEIEALKIKLDAIPTIKQSLDISPSDKLAQMVKESLAEKVNRGLARWDIPTLAIPEIEPVLEVEAPAEEIPFPEVQTIDGGADKGTTGNPTLEQMVAEEESEVVTRAEFSELKKRVWDLENGFSQQAVA